MNTSKLFFSILILLFSNVFCYAQEVAISKEEASVLIRKINENILNSKNFSSRLQYNIYKSHHDTSAFVTSYGYYKRSGNCEHSLQIGIETIQNENERVTIDTANRSIAVADPNNKPQLIEESLSSALAMCKKIAIQKGGDQSVIKFYFDEKARTGFNFLEITYSNTTLFINKISLFYINSTIPGYENIRNPRIDIIYLNISTSKISKSEFDSDNYIEKKKNDYFLQPKYQDYSFYKQINLTKKL